MSRQFASRRPETHVMEALGVAIHGQSFANAAVTDNLAAGYPAAAAHCFNIGMLHTALAGHEGHAPYAPCEVGDLLAKGYDYWALGHVHDHEVVHEAPHIVYPGTSRAVTSARPEPREPCSSKWRTTPLRGFDTCRLMCCAGPGSG